MPASSRSGHRPRGMLSWAWTALVLLGAAFLVLKGGIFILAGLCGLLWIKGWPWFKKKIFQTTPNDNDATSKKYIENGLSVRNLCKEILNDFPHSVATQKRIMFNLRMVEYKLAELEQFLVARGINGKLEYQHTSGKKSIL